MKKKNESDTVQSEKPLFLFSPPGSAEAKDIGYINIPKIFTDPPQELFGERGLHEFTDPFKDVYFGKWFKDDINQIYYLQSSNIWILKEWVKNLVLTIDTEKKRKILTDEGKISDPKFPYLLRYAIKWILCEYGLHCLEQDAEKDFIVFAKNIIDHYRNDKASFIGIVLWERRWRGAEEPIRYLRVAISKQIQKNKSIETNLVKDMEIDMNCPACKEIFKQELSGLKPGKNVNCPYCKEKILFTKEDFDEIKKSRFLSLDQPIVTGNSIDVLDELTGYDVLWNMVSAFDRKEIFEDKFFEESNTIQLLRKACQEIRLSPQATKLEIKQFMNATTLRDAAYSENLTQQEYKKFQKELNRKADLLKRTLRNLTGI